MITTVFLVAAFLYIIELLALRWGLSRADRAANDPAFEPTVSVIVAARNEEERISECLASLSRLDYPAEKLEIIIVDDRSTDRTAEIVDTFALITPAIRRITSGDPRGNLHGKANALSHGIESSHGEILMFTDADCRVPATWVKSTVSFFVGKAGIVGGFTQLDSGRSFEGMQNLDWMFLFGIASSAAGWGIPLTAIGNNLSVRRSAYDATGGYAEIPFSVTEDYALVQAILKKTSFTVRFPLSPGSLVHSRACQTWSQLFRQKQRWGVGGLDMVAAGMLIMIFGWLFRFMALFAWPFVAPGVYAGAIVAVVALEMLYLSRPLRKFGSLACLRHIAAFQLYYLPYVVFTPIVAIFSRDVVWKERTLRKTGP